MPVTFFRVLSALSLVFPCVYQTSLGMRFKIWQFWGHGQEVHLGSAAAETPVESVIGCAKVCMRLEDCRHFCYKRDSRVCYAGGPLTSPNAADFDVNVDCFATEDTCPMSNGYVLLLGRCMKLQQKTKNYRDAKNDCEADGAHLYNFRSVNEDGPPLKKLLTNADIGPGVYNVWVGADCLQAPREFQWSDGTSLPTGSEVWSAGNPDNAEGNENCVWYIRSMARLNDVRCTFLRMSVCQKDF